jgi:DNA-binding NarL/FixJ family response regulator/class 3 adenylate cyclase
MPELPTGTVTFLFSDVEGSTELLRRLRDRYADLMADHERLLRSAFQGAGGHEINTQGDSFFVAFRKPKDAVEAALCAQRAIAGHSWPDDAEMRVRIGIHTGEATVQGDQYLGLAVHRAARICAAAHGGQVLLSQTTQALLEDEEAFGEIDFSDLGPRTLKDFDRPVRIYQLLAPGLESDFPDLRLGDGDKARGSARLADRHEVADAEEAAITHGTGAGIRVLIVDDQALVRTGFRMILDAEDDMEVVGEAANGKEALAEADRLVPDVVLMDVRMPELDGIEATRRLLANDGVDSKVVMLTTFDMDEYVYEALRAGASGFLLKDAPPEQLVAGIRAVCSGEALLAPSVTRRVIEEFVRRPPEATRAAPPEIEELTPRESEVLTLIARGLSNAEIAKSLVVSETTVKTHVARVLMKLQLRDRVQAVVMAYESGLVQAGDAGSTPPATQI